MKKILAILASLFVITGAFVSCGIDSNGGESDSSSSTSSEASSSDSEADESSETDDEKKDDESSEDEKKSDEKKSDDEKSEKKSENSDNSQLVGKWYISEETLETMGDMDGMKIEKDSFVTFSEDNKMELNYILDCASLFSVSDDKLSLYGTEVDYEYDGKTITIKEGENVMTFERQDDPDKDNVYGEYTCPTLFDATSIPGVDEVKINFVSAGKATMKFIASGEYEFDSDAMTIAFKSDSFGSDTSTIEFDGDTLSVTDSSGTVEKYVRAND